LTLIVAAGFPFRYSSSSFSDHVIASINPFSPAGTIGSLNVKVLPNGPDIVMLMRRSAVLYAMSESSLALMGSKS
jgi:hypothetical protein